MMNVSAVASDKLKNMINNVADYLNFELDLPSNVFLGEDWGVWFFERPLLSFVDLFSGVVKNSVYSFSSDVFIKFSGVEVVEGSCYLICQDACGAALSSSRQSEDILQNSLGYPIYFFNSKFDWIAVESAYEEYGVIGLRGSDVKGCFVNFLRENFISQSEMALIAAGKSAGSKSARSFISAYETK
ncbi:MULTISPECIES: hypothetical protein [unclassified Pseudomonas]|uniref:hypothetical protein n=2 Tax=unclassified Pseudomonas TaxID=196821 RepID=UPI0011AEC809|nr:MULTISPECIES: hypothetical protein [unclassified Pseudomonas]